MTSRVLGLGGVRLLSVAVVLLAPIGLGASFASTRGDEGAAQRVGDGNDVAGPLDVVAASVRKVAPRVGRPPALVLGLSTRDGWDSSTLSTGDSSTLSTGREGRNYLAFEFGFDRARRPVRDLCLEVSARPGGELVAQMKRPACALVLAKPVGRPLAVRRSGSRSIQVTVPQSYLEPGARGRRLRAASSFEAPGHPQCAPPAIPPPERSFGTCRDLTRWIPAGGPR